MLIKNEKNIHTQFPDFFVIFLIINNQNMTQLKRKRFVERLANKAMQISFIIKGSDLPK